jgi:hypothetical protein
MASQKISSVWIQNGGLPDPQLKRISIRGTNVPRFPKRGRSWGKHSTIISKEREEEIGWTPLQSGTGPVEGRD